MTAAAAAAATTATTASAAGAAGAAAGAAVAGVAASHPGTVAGTVAGAVAGAAAGAAAVVAARVAVVAAEVPRGGECASPSSVLDPHPVNLCWCPVTGSVQWGKSEWLWRCCICAGYRELVLGGWRARTGTLGRGRDGNVATAGEESSTESGMSMAGT